MDFPRALFVLFLFLSIYLALQFFLFFRLRRELGSWIQDDKRRRLASVILGVYFLLMLYPMALRAIFGVRFYEPYPWALRGFLAFWIVGSVGSALVLLSYDLLRRIAPLFVSRPSAPDSGRREFLRKGVGAAALAPFLVSGYGVVLARRRFQVEQFDFPLNGLSAALSQLSIVQLTDIHAGPFMPEEELSVYVETINRLRPDIIALTGDFVTISPDEAAPCARALSGLKARYGIFACMGNHDVYAGADDELTRLLNESGIRVLRNDAVSIQVANTKINVLGIEDLRRGRPDLSRALNAAQKEPGEIRLLLSHRPEIFPQAARSGVEIVLAGHYHGGQIKLGSDPTALSIARFITPYAEGLFHLPWRSHLSATSARGSFLFVSRGVGTTGLPIRINCPPQIAHLTLRKA